MGALLDYARAEFTLSRLHGKGTVREHLEAQERMTGRTPKRLILPELPCQIEHLWSWFRELAAARTGNGYGPNPIAWTEIAAWAALTGARPTPWEVAALKALDAEYLADAAETARAARATRQPATKQKSATTRGK